MGEAEKEESGCHDLSVSMSGSEEYDPLADTGKDPIPNIPTEGNHILVSVFVDPSTINPDDIIQATIVGWPVTGTLRPGQSLLVDDGPIVIEDSSSDTEQPS